MRTFAILALVLTMALLATGCTGNKIGVVNPARLFQDSESGKAGFEHLKQLEAAMQEQLATAQAMLEKSPDDEALRSRFQQIFSGYQQIVTTEQQKVVEGINEQIQTALESYRKQKGYAAILNSDSVLVFAPEADVTGAIITELNTKPLAFDPVKLEPLAVPEARPAKPAAPKK